MNDHTISSSDWECFRRLMDKFDANSPSELEEKIIERITTNGDEIVSLQKQLEDCQTALRAIKPPSRGN